MNQGPTLKTQAAQGNIDWTLKEMRALHHVVQLGTVTAAATRMGLSQPAVSRLLSGLESKLAQPLFERQGRTLAPTRSALDFYEASIRVFEAIENMRSNPVVLHNVEQLRIAVPPTFAQGFIQDAVALFMQTNTNVTVQIDVRSSPAIFEVITEGAIDLGITDATIRHEAVRDTPFRRSTTACFMRKDHPFAKMDEVNFEAVKEIDIVGLSQRHGTRNHVDRLLAKSEVHARMVIETSTAASAVSFVQSTGAVTFLSPFPVASNLPPDVTFRPLQAGLKHTTRFIHSARIGLKPVARRFMRAVTTVSEGHNNWSSIGDYTA
ncbi:MAG: LysR family transcriptional regulator [Magnetovibrio sp.]|nr:LysR family transcriptional regulator [Magnetovibrio sp.]